LTQLVSVIIPTVHRPQLVLRAIKGVLGQTMREIEAIVVVDGDDPATLRALGSIEDPRFRVKALSTGIGSAGARNVGVGEARGRWIAFLDDDDEWFPEKLAIQVQTAERCPYPHPIVSCRVIARSQEGDLVWPRRTPEMDEPASEYLFCQSGVRGGEGLILPSTVLTTKDLMLQVPFRQDLPRHNDVDWLLRATAVEGVRMVFVPDPKPLAVWHIETDRPRISNTADWRYSLGWIEANRRLVTPRAYASFLLIWASSTAARGTGWKAFWMLPWEAFANGKPRFIDFLAHFLIWSIPRKIRSSISVFLDTRRRKRSWRPDTPNPASPKTNCVTRESVAITVVLSTRGRASVIQNAVRTILQNDYPDFEVIVVDQSGDHLTQGALHPLMSDPRLRYMRSVTTGRSAGLNAGIRQSRGTLMLLTDDDCRVPTDWLRQFEAAFAVDNRIGIVFGNVLPAPHDPAMGCITTYIRQEPFLARGIGDKHRVEGLGACMGVRCDVWQSLSGFDEMLGAGSQFKAGEDGDLAMRALFAGYWIYETPAVWLRHYGFRNWEQLPALIDSYWHGTGAMMVKTIKAGQLQALPLLVRLAGKWVLGRSTVGASLGRPRKRLRKLWSFCRGGLAGATVPVDKKTGHYVRASPIRRQP